MIYRKLLPLLLTGVSMLGGCGTFGERTGGAVTSTRLTAAPNTIVLGTEAETRLVITQPNPRVGPDGTKASNMVTCSEPSPDIALIAANAFSGNVGASGALFSDGDGEQ